MLLFNQKIFYLMLNMVVQTRTKAQMFQDLLNKTYRLLK